MRFTQIDMLPAGTRLFLGARTLDVPNTLAELKNVLAGRERADTGKDSRAGFRMD